MSGGDRMPMVLLDRDGVLNRVCVDAEHGTIDSPLHPSQVEIIPGVPEALALLTEAGFGLSVVTNQPSWAKGKTTRENLDATHAKVIAAAESAGGRILSSHICFHRAEDACSCRKPKTGLLEAAFAQNSAFAREGSWMIGDGVTDVEAGLKLGLRTVFLGPRKCDACKVFEDRGLEPTQWAKDLAAAATLVLKSPNSR